RSPARVPGPQLRHRRDLGAVRLGLAAPAEVARAVDELVEAFGAVPLLVQPMVDAGVAFAIEAVDHPSYGPLVGFGPGGVVGDLLGDRAWRTAPLTDRDADALIRAPPSAPLLPPSPRAPRPAPPPPNPP